MPVLKKPTHKRRRCSTLVGAQRVLPFPDACESGVDNIYPRSLPGDRSVCVSETIGVTLGERPVQTSTSVNQEQPTVALELGDDGRQDWMARRNSICVHGKIGYNCMLCLMSATESEDADAGR